MVLNFRMKKGVELRDSLHGFWEGCGTGKAILKAKLDQ